MQRLSESVGQNATGNRYWCCCNGLDSALVLNQATAVPGVPLEEMTSKGRCSRYWDDCAGALLYVEYRVDLAQLKLAPAFLFKCSIAQFSEQGNR